MRQGECIAEVEAAKTTVEIEAPCDGILARILTPVGTLVPVREVMAVIVSPGEADRAEPGPPSQRTSRPHSRARSRPKHATGTGGARGTPPGPRARHRR